jgi:peptidoglycan/xylan/chitin deacetylase (PgdA/CDA1 family)
MKKALITAALVLGAAAAAAEPLGTARTLVLPREGAAYGRAQHVPLPLAPGEVVITFDDGPRAESTPRVLAALAAEGVKATFFMLGQALEREPALARQVRDAGHTVALHSWAHPNLMQLKADAQRADLDRAQQAFAAVFGAPPAAYRFPFLAVADDTLRLLCDARITVVSGDAGAEDWIPAPNAAALTERLMKSLARDRGGIVILHDVQDQTADALPLMLRTLKDAGYRVVHLQWQSP